MAWGLGAADTRHGEFDAVWSKKKIKKNPDPRPDVGVEVQVTRSLDNPRPFTK